MKPKTFASFFSERSSFLPYYTTEASRSMTASVRGHHVELPKKWTGEKEESLLSKDSLIQRLGDSRHEREKRMLEQRQKEEVGNLLEQIKEGKDPYSSFQGQSKSRDQPLLILEEYYKMKLGNLKQLLILEMEKLKEQKNNKELCQDLYSLFRQEIDNLCET